MQSFDLEAAIARWKKSLAAQQGLEPGFIEELEGNLRDRIEDFLDEGMSEETAFTQAKEKSMPAPSELAGEMYKALSTGKAKPPWERRPSLMSKLPINLKLGLRGMAKRKGYTLLNLGGLVMSIAFSSLIWLYVQDQHQYDRHFENADRIYRVIFDITLNGVEVPQADVGQPVGPRLKADYPEVAEFGRIRRIGATNTLEHEEVKIESRDIFVGDTSFFNVLPMEFAYGNRETALDEPNSIVITEQLALAFFGTTDVLGRSLRYSGEMPPMDIKITGVLKDLNRHTHLPLEAIVSYGTYFREQDLTNWLRKSYTYIKLAENQDIATLETKVPEFVDRYLDVVFEPLGGEANLLFQPLTDIYLDESYLGEPYPHGNRQDLQVLTAVMVFLLLMSAINYVNMATARSTDRALEVGIRKAMGSSRSALFGQFMTEAGLLSAIAGVLALLLCVTVLPFYSSVTGLDWSLSDFLTGANVLSIMMVALLVGTISGIYPSMFLTSFKSLRVLKGQYSQGRRGAVLRKSLIVMQYVIASALIIGISVVAAQIDFVKNRDVGYQRQGLIEMGIPDDPKALQQVDLFVERLTQFPSIRAVSLSEQDLNNYRGTASQDMTAPDGEPVRTVMSYIYVGHDFVEAIGGEMLLGRDFDKSQNNRGKFIINQTALDTYGWGENVTDVRWKGWGKDENWELIGVVKDFILGESYREQPPMMLIFDEYARASSNLFIGVQSGSVQEGIIDIQNVWNETFPGHEFDFQFVSDKLNALYHDQEVFLDLLYLLGIVVVFITAVGIIGLISFTVEKRRKEIAIRKISGASIEAILILLSRQFTTLLIIASAIAGPLGYYLSDEWLSNFDFHIVLNAWPVIITFGLCAVFTVLSLFYHSVRAARENPVEALRYE